jgi:DNA repair exonuclease SbcCD ATPase subunit
MAVRKKLTKEEIMKAFKKKQAEILLEVVEMVDDVVKAKDFNELKEIVRELAEAQKNTEQRVNELAEAQKRTEQRVNELAEAQKKSEERLTKLEITVQELIEAQKKSEERLTKLEITVQELIEAQKRTEQRVNELAEAQKKSEERISKVEERLTKLEITVQELIEAQKKTEEEIRALTQALNRTREELKGDISNLRKEFGGFQRSMSYAFENEAFRMLPGVLKEKYGIEVTEKFIRKEVRGKEINVFGRGRINVKDVLIVGEAKIRLEEKGIDTNEKKEWIEKIFDELEDKVRAVQEENREIEIVRILITHFATSTFLEEARKRGVIVIQSFEW